MPSIICHIQNFDEHVHANENRILSKHGPYVHAIAGTKKHRETMEYMAKEVRKC